MLKPSWNDYKNWLVDDLRNSWNDHPRFDPPFTAQIKTDSRQLKKGDFFIPLRGEKFDGHNFIKEALANGASGFLYEDGSVKNLTPTEIAQGIPVKNTLLALAHIARGYLKLCDPAVRIALTGSVGKTTLKEITSVIFQQSGKTLATQGSFNNEIGVPHTILNLTGHEKYLICEIAARHVGDIRYLTEMIDPTVGVVANVKSVHLSEFKTLENVYLTKSEVFRHSNAHTTLVCLRDDEKLWGMASSTGKQVIGFGVHQDAHVRIVDARWHEPGSTDIDLNVKGTKHTITVPYCHESLPINVACATAIAISAGLDIEVVASGLKNFRAAPGRFRVLHGGELIVIDDSYNASPDSVMAGMRSCIKMYPNKKIALVLGNMEELGEQSRPAHLEVGRQSVKLVNPDLLITVGEKAKLIAEGAKEAGLSKDRLFSFDDVDQAIRLPEKIFLKREVWFIKGSHSVGLEKLVKTLVPANE